MTTTTPESAASPSAKRKGQEPPKPRVVHNPNDVANLVLLQMDLINAKKDDLTIAIKGLTDLTKQLVHAYANHTRTIQELMERVRGLEEKAGKLQGVE